MAPEQAMGSEVGPWTDLYQSGVVAFELLSGAVPFRADESPVAVMMQHINDPLPPLPEGTDPALDAWVRTMVAKDPGERFGSAAVAWEELEEIVIRLAGPLWRRGARLADPEPTREQSRPLSPAPFTWHEDAPRPVVPPRGGTGEVPELRTYYPETPPSPPSAGPAVAWRISAPDADATVTRPISPSSPPRWRPFVLPIVVLGLLVVAAVAAVLLSGGNDDGASEATVTQTATNRFPVGDKPDGVALGAGAVWVALSGEGKLARVDQDTEKTVKVDVGKNPDSVVFDGDSVWVSVTGADQVVQVSADARPKVIRKIDVGLRPDGLDVSSRAVWVANSGDGSVSQVVKASGTVNTVPDVAAQPVDVAI